MEVKIKLKSGKIYWERGKEMAQWVEYMQEAKFNFLHHMVPKSTASSNG